MRSSVAAPTPSDPDECFVANAIASPELAARSDYVERDRPASRRNCGERPGHLDRQIVSSMAGILS